MDPFTGFMIGSQVLGGLGGFLGGQKQAEKAKERYHYAQNALFKQIGNTRLAMNKSEGLLKQNLAGIGAGYANAGKLLGNAGNTAKQFAKSQQTQQLSSLAQNMASRGLGGTTVLDNAQRGIYSDTSRRMAEIDEGIGGMLAELALGKTQAQSAARSDLANFYGMRNQAEIADRESLINLWLGSIPQASNPAAGIGQLGGSLGQMYMLQSLFGGGGAGAAAAAPKMMKPDILGVL